MKKGFYIFLLLCCMQATAQDSTDRYAPYNRILRIKDDSVRCLKLIEYGEKLRDSVNDYQLAQLVFSRAAAITGNARFPTLILRNAASRAYCAFMQGEFAKADTWYVQALSSPLLAGDPETRADLLNKAGANLQNIGVYKRALQYYDQTLEYYTKINDEKGKAMVYINMANVFVSMGDLKKADELYTLAGGIFLQKGLRDNYATVLGNQAVARLSMGDKREALNMMLRAYRFVGPKPKDRDQPVVLRFNTGLMYAETQQWDSSFYYLKQGWRFADSLGLAPSFTGTYNYNLGWVYEKKGDIPRALSYYKKALDQKAGIYNYKNILDYIANLYLLNRQTDSAYIYKALSARITDSVYTSELKENARFADKRMELLEKDYQNQIALAQQEQEVSALRSRIMMLVGLLVLFIITALLGFLFYQRNQLRKKKEHLQGELDFLRAQLNPHFLFNSINNIYVLLDEDRQKASAVLLMFSDLLRYQLYECNVPFIPLAKELNYLKNYLAFEELRYAGKINTSVVFPESIPADLQIAPLILQPFIENAFKHTRRRRNEPGSIRIRLAIEGLNMHLSVINTRQLNVASTLPGGVGLDNVKKRLSIIYPGRHNLKLEAGPELFTVNLHITLNK